ncbi:MAG: hypothetical protein QOF89_5503 [Acidobacteriota bacterium]|jgi:hypothetical protein|nr:hypothetical protein [Acidobacteriota bacterium]
MKIRRLLASSLVFFAFASGAAFAQEKEGTVTVKLTMAEGVQDNGSPAPSKNAACTTKYKAYIGSPVVNTYKINPKTLIMSASANFQNVSTQLYPMGLSSYYGFISDGIPPELAKLGVDRIIFHISKQFTAPKNMIMFPLETGFNCVLTNSALSAAAAKEALTGKPMKH